MKAEKIEFAPVLEESSKEFLRRRNRNQQHRRRADRGVAQRPHRLPTGVPENDARQPLSRPASSGSAWDQVDARLRQEGLVSISPRVRGSGGRRLEASEGRGGGGVSSPSFGGWLKGKLTSEG
jgi:hypothetical protein